MKMLSVVLMLYCVIVRSASGQDAVQVRQEAEIQQLHDRMKELERVWQESISKYDANKDGQVDDLEYATFSPEDIQKLIKLQGGWSFKDKAFYGAGETDVPGDVITQEGLALSCMLFGKGAGNSRTPIILIHDLDGKKEDLYPLARVLSEQHGYFVVVPDLRGHGNTRWIDARRPPLKPRRLSARDVWQIVNIDLDAVLQMLVVLNDQSALNLAKLTVGGVGKGAVVAAAYASTLTRIPVQAMVLLSTQDNFQGLAIKPLVDRWDRRRCDLGIYVAANTEDSAAADEAKRVYLMLTRGCRSSTTHVLLEERIHWLVVRDRMAVNTNEDLTFISSLHTQIQRGFTMRSADAELVWKRIEPVSSGGSGSSTRTIIIRVPR